MVPLSWNLPRATAEHSEQPGTTQTWRKSYYNLTQWALTPLVVLKFQGRLIYTLSNQIHQDSRHNLVLSLLWPVRIHCHRTMIVSLCVVTRKIRSLESHYIMINFSRKSQRYCKCPVSLTKSLGKTDGRQAWGKDGFTLDCWCTA